MSLLALAVGFLLNGAQSPEPQFFGVYYLGKKVGYREIDVSTDQVDGQTAIKTENKWSVNFKLYGQQVDRPIDATTWTTPDNRLLRDVNVTRSGRQVATIQATFSPNGAELDMDTDGNKSHKSLPQPNGPVYADVYRLIHDKPGQTITYWTFSTGNDAFSKVELHPVGPSSYKAGDKTNSAILTEEKIDGNKIRIFQNENGDVLREEWSIGLVETAEPKETALQIPTSNSSLADLAMLSSLKPDRRIDNVLSLNELKLRMTGFDLSSMPSDDIQTTTQDGDAWLVEAHPPRNRDSANESIEMAKVGQPDWTHPAEDIPSDSPEMITLASSITKSAKNVIEAATAIVRYVHRSIQDDNGFGVERDAAEILHDKRGKCTDYAILTTTLMRAARIPSRIVSGLLVSPTYHLPNYLVYHAWSEIWDGRQWLGMDSALGRPQLTAAYIKLCQGNANEALALITPDPAKVKIEVLDSQPR